MEAVLIIHASSRSLFPLTSGDCPAPLLPVLNRPLLAYPLRLLETSKVAHVIAAVIGEPAACAAVSAWLTKEYPPSRGLKLDIVSFSEDTGTAQALGAVASRLRSDDFLVVPGDVVADVCLQTVFTSHKAQGATATVVLFPRKSPAAETKPGKPPKGVDYVGLDAPGSDKLVFYASSGANTALKALQIPTSLLKRAAKLSIRTDLQDSEIYVLHRSALEVLEGRQQILSLKKDLLPALVATTAAPPATPSK
jgi:translation initiation factor eIF-2B subunit gamma